MHLGPGESMSALLRANHINAPTGAERANDRVATQGALEQGGAFALFVDDDELRRRINPKMGRDRFRAAVRAAEQRGFPKIHPLWSGRYWPAVQEWLDLDNGPERMDSVLMPKTARSISMPPRGKTPGLKRGRHDLPYWIASQVRRDVMNFPDKCIPLPPDADMETLSRLCHEHSARLDDWIAMQSAGDVPLLPHYDGSVSFGVPALPASPVLALSQESSTTPARATPTA